MGSQPTYEELKRHLFGSSLDGYTGSQPTYEELKLHLLAANINANGGSQPTYEELKPSARACPPPGYHVLSLPMRN